MLFGHDQLDLNFKEPRVLLEMVGVLGELLKHGVRGIRLDAIAYLWKQAQSSCINLPQTHEVVRLLHALAGILPRSSGAPYRDQRAPVMKT